MVVVDIHVLFHDLGCGWHSQTYDRACVVSWGVMRGDERNIRDGEMSVDTTKAGVFCVPASAPLSHLPAGEFIAGGSDDGRWFIWEKQTGRLVKMLAGDEHGGCHGGIGG